MEVKRSKQASLLLWTAIAALLSQNLAVPVLCAVNFEDQKNYYSPDPNTGTPPSVPSSPPHHATPTPTPTPYHGTPPSSGGHKPPSNCGNPPSGGHHHPTPSPPTGGGGGYYRPPATPTPTTPTPTTPTPPTPTYVSPPVVPTPPTTPIDPGTPTTPGIPVPTPPFAFPGTPPFSFNPNSPPFTCPYWRNHPTLIWGLLGWWGTVGNAFGVTSLPGIGAHMNLLQALSNTRPDGFGELYREGTAALLNSMAHVRFPYTTSQVRDSFAAALGSNNAAAAQAHRFRMANEGRTKPKA